MPAKVGILFARGLRVSRRRDLIEKCFERSSWGSRGSLKIKVESGKPKCKMQKFLGFDGGCGFGIMYLRHFSPSYVAA